MNSRVSSLEIRTCVLVSSSAWDTQTQQGINIQTDQVLTQNRCTQSDNKALTEVEEKPLQEKKKTSTWDKRLSPWKPQSKEGTRDSMSITLMLHVRKF